jgi:hypothetical protein
MNTQLNALYSNKWEVLSQKLMDINQNEDYKIKPSNPLLISLEDSDYETADIKLVVIGQETNSWDGNFKNDIGSTQTVYKDFVNSGNALNSYGGHFWNGVNRFLYLLKGKYQNHNVGFVYNNLVKIGCKDRNMNKPPSYIYEVEKEHFNVLKEELAILKPNIILFLSGPNYDYAINDSFGGFSLNSISPEYSTRQLSKLDIGYGNNVFRTYHPNFLYRNKIDNYFNTIIKAVEL